MENNITILNFSGRNTGNCSSITEVIKRHHKNTNICVYQINKLFSPCNNCNYECLRENEKCEYSAAQEALLETIFNSRLVYFIIPNYCGFPCANYFAFNERTVGLFNGNKDRLNQYMNVKKKFILISNAESKIFEAAMEQQAVKPEILYMKSRAYGKQSIDGDLMDSKDALQDLLKFLDSENL